MTRTPMNPGVGESTGADSGQNSENGLVPAGRYSPPGSPLEQAEPGTSSPPVRPGPRAGMPVPETGATSASGVAPVRDTAPRTPAAGMGASPKSAAGPKALSGAEWRKAAKDAQSKTRRRKTTPAAKSAVPLPSLPDASGVQLTATADCNGCEWTAGPGDAASVDRAAEKHVRVGHSTAVIAEPEAGAA